MFETPTNSATSSNPGTCRQQSTTLSWPPIRRIQILALSAQAGEALFPEIGRKDIAEPSTLPDPQPIIRHLSGLLQNASGRCLPVRQFQTFTVGHKVHVVVDMEAVGRGRTFRGLLSFSTSIIAEGPPLEQLSSLHLCIVRPFPQRERKSPSPKVAEPDRYSAASPPPHSFSFRRFFRFQSQSSLGDASSENLDSSTVHGPVMVDLQATLRCYLRRYPCMVFSPGQQIVLPLLPEFENLEAFSNRVSLTKGIVFFVYSTSCNTMPGVVIPNLTDITIELDPIGEFDQIDVSPLVDTIPESYEFDFFNDYIKPFVEANPFRLLFQGSLFSFHGVQFKVQHTRPCKKDEAGIPDEGQIYWKGFRGQFTLEDSSGGQVVTPIESLSSDIRKGWYDESKHLLNRIVIRRGYVCRRIGRATRIHRSDPVQPQLRDMLPPSVMDEVVRLPTRLQSIAAIHAIADLAPQDLIRILGLAISEPGESSQQQMRQQVAAKVLSEYATIYQKVNENNSEHVDDTSDGVCIVCLSSVAVGDQVLELPCSHIFHLSCVEEWLKRSLVCPVCKRDLRDFLAENEQESTS